MKKIIIPLLIAIIPFYVFVVLSNRLNGNDRLVSIHEVINHLEEFEYFADTQETYEDLDKALADVNTAFTFQDFIYVNANNPLEFLGFMIENMWNLFLRLFDVAKCFVMLVVNFVGDVLYSFTWVTGFTEI